VPKRPGKPEAGRRSERPVSLRRAKYCPNGGMAFATITTNRRSTESRRGGQTKGHERRSWPLSRTRKQRDLQERTAKWSHNPRFGGSHALVWLSRANRGRSSGSVAPRSRASREPAFVPGARCNSSRPHGRGRDQHPRVADDRWHTNASRRVLRHGGRWQLPTGGGNGRARREGGRDVGPAARRAGTTYPTASESSSRPDRSGPAVSLAGREKPARGATMR